MEITLDGPRTIVTVNGQKVTDYTEGEPVPPKKLRFEPDRGRRPDQGYFGLQNHSDNDIVFFKEVAIKPLKSGSRANSCDATHSGHHQRSSSESERGMGLFPALAANMLKMVGVGPFLTIPIILVHHEWAAGAARVGARRDSRCATGWCGQNSEPLCPVRAALMSTCSKASDPNPWAA